MTRLAAASSDLEPVEEILEQGGEAIRARFDQIYTYYRPLMEAHARRRGSEDPEGAADLALFAGYQAADRLRDRSEPAFRAYLYRATANASAREARSAYQKFELTDLSDQNVPVEPSFEAAFDDRHVLMSSIDQLVPDQQEVITMMLSGMTASEVAEATDRKRNAVYQLQRRGILSLRSLLRAAAVLAAIVAALFGFRALSGPSAELIENQPIDEVERQIEDENSRPSATEDRAGVSVLNPLSTTVPEGGADEPENTTGTERSNSPSETTTTQGDAGNATDPGADGELAGVNTTSRISTTAPEVPADRNTFAADDAVTVEVGAPISFNVIANDSPSEAVRRLTPGSGCLAGSNLYMLADGSIAGTASAAGTYTCTYTLFSTSGSSASASLVVTVNDVAPLPILTPAPIVCNGDADDIKVYFAAGVSVPDTYQLLGQDGDVLLVLALGDAQTVDYNREDTRVEFSDPNDGYGAVRSVVAVSEGLQPSEVVSCS